MKTIEERADAYVGHPEEIDEFTSATIKRDAYIRGAKEQKAIDDEKLSRFKSSWEREAQINHNDENNYKQGFHDAIEEAYEWLKARNVLTDASLEGFIKIMEDSYEKAETLH